LLPGLPNGTQIAGYRIETLIAQGGMSRVYRAEQVALERKVALKVLLAELGQDPLYRERFLRESRLAASIDHPNIVPIYDAGDASGYLYIAMKLILGMDLRALLSSGTAIHPTRALSFLHQAASALDAAHGHGLIHRDIKPANFLVADDHLYLTDFGVARIGQATHGMTRIGLFVGTIDFASPEQIRNEPLDQRSDIYSLACVFYQCLTGIGPFDRPTEHGVLQAQLTEMPASVRAFRPELPGALDGVFATALAKDRNERYRSGRALADAARWALEGRVAEIPTRPTVVEGLSRTLPPGRAQFDVVAPQPDRTSPVRVTGSETGAIRRQPPRRGATLLLGTMVVAVLLGLVMVSRAFSVSLADVVPALLQFLGATTAEAPPSPTPSQLASIEATALARGWRTHSVRPGETTFGIADAEGVSRTALVDANLDYYPDIAKTTPAVGALILVPRSVSAASMAPTPTPVPTPRRVLLSASQIIMPPTEFPFTGYTVITDEVWGGTGWYRRFASTNGDYFRFAILIKVLAPDRSAASEVAKEPCNLTFTGTQPVVREVPAAVIGEAAKACEYHFEGNIADVQEYITATRNVEILVWGTPRRTSITNAQAMNQMIAIARQQIEIIEKIAPR
jgi:tRNA A-37 threonylcarbamoyl transferase component Bud32